MKAIIEVVNTIGMFAQVLFDIAIILVLLRLYKWLDAHDKNLEAHSLWLERLDEVVRILAGRSPLLRTPSGRSQFTPDSADPKEGG